MKIYDFRINGDGDLEYSAGTNGSIVLNTGSVDFSDVVEPNVSLTGTDNFDLNSDNYVNINSGSDVNINAVNDTWLFSQNDINLNAVNNIKAYTDIRYNADYSGNYTSRSLVDKAYIDGRTTSNISEGTNFYFNNSRFDTRLATKTTSNISEGTNFYYTDARFDNRLITKTIVRVRSTANLTSTYSNGSSGVGATLTATTNVVLPAQDSVSLVVGDRILVPNQTTTFQNGIYVVTSLGSAGVSPWILTRADDADTATEIYNSFVLVKEGTIWSNTNYNNSNTSTAITLGTTAITYILSGGYTISTGLTLTNRTLTTTAIAAGAITRAMLANGTACTVIGRSANSTGAVADISAGSDGQYLKRTGGALSFSAIDISELPFQILSNSFTTTASAQSTFTVTIGQTLANTGYKVTVTPTSSLASANFYIANKSTTTFDVVYASALTGLVAFDWILYK